MANRSNLGVCTQRAHQHANRNYRSSLRYLANKQPEDFEPARTLISAKSQIKRPYLGIKNLSRQSQLLGIYTPLWSHFGLPICVD